MCGDFAGGGLGKAFSMGGGFDMDAPFMPARPLAGNKNPALDPLGWAGRKNPEIMDPIGMSMGMGPGSQEEPVYQAPIAASGDNGIVSGGIAPRVIENKPIARQRVDVQDSAIASLFANPGGGVS
jgi:hypothetical protein